MTSSSTRLLRVTREGHKTGHELSTAPDDRASALPVLLTVAEAADLLRTSSRAIDAMVERRQLPAVVRIRRRVLFRADVLLEWLCREPSMQPAENHRRTGTRNLIPSGLARSARRRSGVSDERESPTVSTWRLGGGRPGRAAASGREGSKF